MILEDKAATGKGLLELLIAHQLEHPDKWGNLVGFISSKIVTSGSQQDDQPLKIDPVDWML